jgi:hypothetical protein
VRKILQRIAFALAAATVVAVVGWLAFGENRIWTQTTVTRWQKDPVTEIDGPVVEKKFVPGLDLVAVCLTGALALFIASLFVSKTKNKSVSSSS